MSNWEQRPLRYSQEHYAAMDAWILGEVVRVLDKMAQEKGDKNIQKAIFINPHEYQPSKEKKDKKSKENNENPDVPKTQSGKPDMRFNVNKDKSIGKEEYSLLSPAS